MSKRIADTPCYCLKMWRSAENVIAYYNKMLAPSGVTARQGALLRAISEHNGCNIRELSQVTALDSSTLARNLKPLLQAGYVLNQKEPGRRDSVLTLSGDGERVCSEAIRLWEEAQRQFEKKLGQEQLEALQKIAVSLQTL